MKARGFTLIELIIVIAILSVLLIIAIPNYQTYLIRSRVYESLALASSAQLAVVKAAVSGKDLSVITSIQSTNIADLKVSENGVITLYFTALAGNGSLILTPSHGAGIKLRKGVVPTSLVYWGCEAGTLDPKYVPSNCR